MALGSDRAGIQTLAAWPRAPSTRHAAPMVLSLWVMPIHHAAPPEERTADLDSSLVLFTCGPLLMPEVKSLYFFLLHLPHLQNQVPHSPPNSPWGGHRL